MTDSLRDRIAAVLARHYPQTTGYRDELTDWCQCGLPRDHVADAVIAELALREDKVGSLTRYVTEWTGR